MVSEKGTLMLVSPETADKINQIFARLPQLDRIEHLLQHKVVDPEWVNKEEAMRLLNRKEKKLQQLVLKGVILVNQNPGKGVQLMYNLASIKKYIANPNRALKNA